ncbi:hypothetical protein ACSBL2_19590 [Pedobacter sp. AW31-3R]|uniref:hypothetical protein n=1 Tax=Pedobacter sp. AW31-3R TaxID=3445781 RepID=UPI003F9F7DD4
MIHNSIAVSLEFGLQVKKYLEHFGLTEGDLSRLINSNTNKIQDILSGKTGIVLNSAEKISNVFGLRYFELGNPLFSIPLIEYLPEETQKFIEKRKVRGIPVINRNYSNDIAGNLDKIINESDVLHFPVTAEEIRLRLPKEIRDTIKASRITDLLKKSGRDKIVIQVDKRGKEFLFQLKEFALGKQPPDK